jgi:molybdopterin-binding protein
MMPEYRISEAAALLGVSDDTVRRWGEHGRLTLRRGANGMQVVDGTDLVPLMAEVGPGGTLAEAFPLARASARNRFVGLVTRVQRDGVMAQVDLQAGPFRVVSLMSREAADDLGLEPGMLAAASVKATNVTIELPPGSDA